MQNYKICAAFSLSATKKQNFIRGAELSEFSEFSEFSEISDYSDYSDNSDNSENSDNSDYSDNSDNSDDSDIVVGQYTSDILSTQRVRPRVPW